MQSISRHRHSIAPGIRFWRGLLLCAALLLGGCATLWGGGDQEAPPASDTPKDRSQQRVRVFITGVKGEMKQAVSSALELKGLMSRSDASDALVKRVHRRGAAQMAKALQPFGFYHAKIESTLIEEGNTWFARFSVDPGPPTKVVEVDVGVSGPGAEDERVKRSVARFAPRPGEVLDHRIYEASKARISDALTERGYLSADTTARRVGVRLAEHSARINLQFESGPLFKLGETRIEGAQFPEALMLDFLPFQVGDDFRQTELLKLQQRLLESDYFSEVEIEVDPEQAVDYQVPILVRVVPAKRTVYTGGVSFGTDTGAGVLGGINRRWLNDRGHKANVRTEISQNLQSLGGQYLIPLRGGQDRRSFLVGMSYRDETTKTTVEELTILQVGFRRENDAGTFAYGLAAQSGDFEVGELPGNSTLYYPEVRWMRREADDFLKPTRGWSVVADVRAAPSGLGDAGFAYARAEGRVLRPHGEMNRWVARLTLGALWTDDFDSMPPNLRFFAGGDRSLRGFGFQELGPLNSIGEVNGGRYLAVGSLEYERHLFGDFGLAGFVDAGNAFDAGDFEVAAGVGLGLRWRSPVGLVRVDLAAPVAGDGDGLRLHLVIGPEI
jgi:translocation and assembly module TamA